jgi:hypothetical protein
VRTAHCSLVAGLAITHLTSFCESNARYTRGDLAQARARDVPGRVRGPLTTDDRDLGAGAPARGGESQESGAYSLHCLPTRYWTFESQSSVRVKSYTIYRTRTPLRPGSSSHDLFY